MASTILKIFLGIILVGLVALAAWPFMIMSVFDSLNEDTRQVEKQIIVEESFSPDLLTKIGVYKYNSGALGYTAIQMAVVDSSEGYPLSGNVLTINRIPPRIEWNSVDSVTVLLDTSNTPGFRIEPRKIIKGIKFGFTVQ